jgi:hypothetical protein
MLKQEPLTFTNVKGQQPAGQWAITGHDAEAGAASGAKGIRYNSGTIHMAGDGAPGPLAMGNGGAGGSVTASGGLPCLHFQSVLLRPCAREHITSCLLLLICAAADSI